MLVLTVTVLVCSVCCALLVFSSGQTPTFCPIDALIFLMHTLILFQLVPWPLPHRHSLGLG